MAKRQRTKGKKGWSTKQITEHYRSSNTNPTKTGVISGASEG
jgi:hypothetical protein